MTVKKCILAVLAGLALLLGVAVAPASAGTNNGTSNWYWSKTCYASGGNLNVTNYDVRSGSRVWQRYHVDADRAGGVGAAPTIYRGGVYLAAWNDFNNDFLDWRYRTTYRVVFANGSACSITG